MIHRCFILPSAFPRLTSTAALHVPHLMDGIGQQVRESSVQVHRRKAALVSFPGCYQPGQAAVHALPNAANVQLTCEIQELAKSLDVPQLSTRRCVKHRLTEDANNQQIN